MSVTGQFTTFQDLYTGVLNAVRSQTTQASTVSQAKRAVNIALQDMHLGQDYQFYWAERNATLILQPPYTTGTVSITTGTTALTGVGTLWDTAGTYGVNNLVAGDKIVLAGTDVVYRVASVTDDTNAVLDSLYVGATLSGSSYTTFKDEYTPVSDYMRPVDMRFFDDNHEIQIVDRRQLRRKFPRNSVTGRPQAVAQIELGPSSNMGEPELRPRLVFTPPPDAVYNIPYTYITNNLVCCSNGVFHTEFTLDSDEPIVPFRYRHALYYYALKIFYEHKDDVRAQQALQDYISMMQRIVNDVSVGDQRLRIEPRQSHYTHHAEAPYNYTSRFDVNNAFDRME